MKKLTFLLVILIICSVNLLAQDWIQISSTVNSNLYSVKLNNANTGIVVGDNATILKTTNGGVDWISKSSNQNNFLNGVYFISSQKVIAIGVSGTIVISTDVGESWTVINTSTTENLASISFVNENTGFISGSNSVVMKTVNGGLNWQTVSISSGAFPSCYFFDSNTGIAAGFQSSSIKKTTNSGVNWTNVYYTPNTPMSIFFSNATTGFTVGVNGFISKTTNSGNSWNTVQMATKNYTLYYGKFLNQDVGLATGRIDGSGHGIILKTVNGGENWTFYDSLSDGVNDIAYTQDGRVIAVCDSGKIFISSSPIGIHNISTTIPTGFSLSQNYPNPFNPTTNIKFAISKKGFAKLVVFDITGKEIETLVNQTLSPGEYEFNFDARSLSSGTYFYRLQVDNFVSIKKMVLLK